MIAVVDKVIYWLCCAQIFQQQQHNNSCVGIVNKWYFFGSTMTTTATAAVETTEDNELCDFGVRRRVKKYAHFIVCLFFLREYCAIIIIGYSIAF